MLCSYTAMAALLGFAYPAIVLANAQACKQDACLSKVVQGGKGACGAFFETTVVPQSITTTTTTRIKTSFTVEVTSVTFQTTTSTTSFFTTSTETDTQGSTTTSLPPSPTGQQQQKLLRRTQATAITYSSTTVPAYATKACPNTVVYSSACSCVGATHHKTTLPPQFKTKTVTQRSTTVRTIHRTTTVATSTTTAVSIDPGTSTTTTTVPSVIVGGQCTQVSDASNDFTYSNYYSGQGYEESPNNPGNQDPGIPPPETADFTDLGENDACAAIQRCTNFAFQLSPNYYSFDIHYLSSSAMWECVAYFESNTDPSYFSVANPDITEGYGFSTNGR